MRILYCCNEYPPSKAGGIGNVTKVIAESLVKRGHNVFVVGYYASQKEECVKEVINGVVVYRINKPTIYPYLRLLKNLLLNKIGHSLLPIQSYVDFYENHIQRIIDQESIDVLEMADFYEFNAYKTTLKFKEFSIPAILRVHGSMSFIQSVQGFCNKESYENDYRHFSRCSYLSSVSSFSQNHVLSAMSNLSFKKNVVIYNPIEDEFASRVSNHTSNDTILFLGKIVKTKGAFNLIQSFCEFSKTHPSWKLKLVGDGEIERAKSWVSKECKKKVMFLGYCNRETVKQEIDSCTFACIPSYFENFSMAALEVMGRGKALIYTIKTSGSEVIQNMENGILVDPENNKQIVEALSLLSDNETMRYSLAEKAHLTVKGKFTVSKLIKEFEDFYSSICEISERTTEKQK